MDLLAILFLLLISSDNENKFNKTPPTIQTIYKGPHGWYAGITDSIPNNSNGYAKFQVGQFNSSIASQSEKPIIHPYTVELDLYSTYDPSGNNIFSAIVMTKTHGLLFGDFIGCYAGLGAGEDIVTPKGATTDIVVPVIKWSAGLEARISDDIYIMAGVDTNNPEAGILFAF